MPDFLHPADSPKSREYPKSKRIKKGGNPSSGAKKIPLPASEGMGVNLMSEDALKAVVAVQEKKSAKILAWSVLSALLLTILLFVGVKAYGFYNLQRERQLFSDLGRADTEVATLEKRTTELNDFTSKLEVLQKIFESHVYWTQFITALEQYTLPTVTYAGLSVAQGSSLSFSATAPDFRTLGRQLLIYQTQATSLMSGVKISSGRAQLNQQGEVVGVNFDVTFTMNPEVLKKK